MLELPEVERPYPGLRPFEIWEGEIFFGREEHTNRLLEILQREHFLAVIGPSGSGKSSLVRAGLLPALPLGAIGTGADWRIAILKPGNRPIQRLAQALLAPSALGKELTFGGELPAEGEVTPAVELVEAELRRGPLGLIHLAAVAAQQQAWNPGEPEPQRFNLLVLVDQFEEIFTHAEAGERQSDESEAFVNLLLAPRAVRESRVFVAITMRTDFLGSCVRFLELPDAINRAQYLTPRLTQAQTRQAILAPARSFGGDVEPALTAELLNQLGNDSDRLPVLQHALARLWDSGPKNERGGVLIDAAAVKDSGGLQDALSNHAQALWKSLPEDGQRAAEWLFRAITEQREAEAGGQAVRRPQTLKQVAEWSGLPWESFKPVVEKFAHSDASFLHFQGNLESTTVVDISHEALIRKWKTLAGWVESEARRATEFRRWRERTESWLEGGELLTGSDLLRAVEWRTGSRATETEQPWTPAAAWAQRYRRREALPPKPGGEPAEAKDEGKDGAKPDEGPKKAEFEVVLDYIEKSRGRQQRKERWKFGLRLFVVLASLGVALITSRLYLSALQRADKEAATSIWTQLTFAGGKVTPMEDRTLLRLARAPLGVKKEFLRQLFDQEVFAQRYRQLPGVVTHAAVGTSETMRKALLDLAGSAEVDETFTSIDRRTAQAIVALQLGEMKVWSAIRKAFAGVADPSRRGTIATALAGSAARLPQTQARILAKDLLAEMRGTASAIPPEALQPILLALVPQLADETILDLVRDPQLQSRILNSAASLPAERQRPLVASALQAVAAPGGDEALAGLVGIITKAGDKVPEDQRRPMASQALALALASTEPNRREALTLALSTFVADLQAEEKPAAVKLLLTANPPKAESSVSFFGQRTPQVQLGTGLALLADEVPSGHIRTAAKTILAAIQEARLGELRVLTEGLERLSSRLGPVPASSLAADLMQAVEETRDSGKAAALGRGLVALFPALPAEQVDEYLNTLVVEPPPEVDPDIDYRLEALEVIGSRLPRALAPSLIDRVLREMETTRDSDRVDLLSSVLISVLSTLPESQRLPIFDSLLLAAERSNQVFLAVSFVETAAAIASSSPPETARRLNGRLRDLGKKLKARPGFGVFATAPNEPDPATFTAESSPNLLPWVLNQFGSARTNADEGVPFIRRDEASLRLQILPEATVGPLAEKLIETARGASPIEQKIAASQALIALADRIPESLSASAAEVLLEEIGRTPFTSQELTSYSPVEKQAQERGLGKVAAKVPERAAGGLARSIVGAIRPTMSQVQLAALGQGLVATIAKMPAKEAPALTRALLARIKTSFEPYELGALGDGLAAAAGRVDAADARQSAQEILASLQEDKDSLRVTALEKALGPIGTKLGEAPELLLEVLKYPQVPREDLLDVLRARHPGAPKKDEGYWAFIRWANREFPQAGLDQPVR